MNGGVGENMAVGCVRGKQQRDKNSEKKEIFGRKHS